MRYASDHFMAITSGIMLVAIVANLAVFGWMLYG